MELLEGYSSGEEEESLSDFSLKEEKLGKNQDIERNYPIELENLNIFSQNYYNQTNMTSCFLYLPWRPSLKTVSSLKRVVNLAMDQLKKDVPQVMENYNWKPIKNGNLDYHISLYPNIRGDGHSINQFIQNLSSGISTIKINSNLIGYDSDEIQRMNNLKSLLMKKSGDNGVFKPKKYINFGLKSSLSLFKSASTESLFLACKIDMSKQETGELFNSLNSYINENLSLLDLETTSQELSYHLSIQIGEPKNLHRLSSDELEKLNMILEKLDLSVHLVNLNVHVNELIVYLLSEEKKFIHVPFDI